ncbi:MAG: type II toxin-antitoxin system prevent-host-death family antitoxin [bacterium]
MNTKQLSIIGLRDLRENLVDYIDQIKKGKSFTVVKRSEPIFKISPIIEDDEDERWETIIDFTKIKKGGVDIDEVLKRL